MGGMIAAAAARVVDAATFFAVAAGATLFFTAASTIWMSNQTILRGTGGGDMQCKGARSGASGATRTSQRKKHDQEDGSNHPTFEPPTAAALGRLGADSMAAPDGGAGSERVNSAAKGYGPTPFRATTLRVAYGTQTGTAKRLAQQLIESATSSGPRTPLDCSLINLKHYDVDNLEQEALIVFVICTWEGGTPPQAAAVFCDWLEDLANDFRCPRTFLQNVSYAVFGIGDSEYAAKGNFCKAALKLDEHMARLGARRVAPFRRGDSGNYGDDVESQFGNWCSEEFWPAFNRAKGETAASSATNRKNGDALSWDALLEGGLGDSGGGVTMDPMRRQDGTAPSLLHPRRKTEAEKLPRKEYRRQQRKMRQRERLAKRQKERLELQKRRGGTMSSSVSDASFATDGAPGSTAGMSLQELLQREREQAEDALNASLVDMEDLGSLMHSQASTISANLSARDQGTDSKTRDVAAPPIAAALLKEQQQAALEEADRPEMVTPMQRRALKKEGYKIIGTHSAVKLCRWTKHQLRGRGGCYKHTCYGIVSYQCMEATPSLACANKCVFCWRHHKNPVGTSWRWKQDSPDQIVTAAIEKHRTMIRGARGIPGVKADRWSAAISGPRHCALSLVGEPIMYPKINDMLRLLDDKAISTFLVTNAQFPECIQKLGPCTQLYVSIDAATRDALKAVDRPLFPDFWERFLASIDALRKKDLMQRTVFRMTLVKAWNMDTIVEAERYADLIRRGKPDFIEIKSVTFCGVSDGSSLTMQNVPWYEEVVKYAEAVCSFLPDEYKIACAHKHSCLVLIAHTCYYMPAKVSARQAEREAEEAATYVLEDELTAEEAQKAEGRELGDGSDSKDSDSPRGGAKDMAWHTWIDYPKWTKLVKEYHASGGKKTFSKFDYVARTPDWAIFGAEEQGFSPYEVHFKRSKSGRTVTGEKQGSASAIARMTSVSHNSPSSARDGNAGRLAVDGADGVEYESDNEGGGCG